MYFYTRVNYNLLYIDYLKKYFLYFLRYNLMYIFAHYLRYFDEIEMHILKKFLRQDHIRISNREIDCRTKNYQLPDFDKICS